MKAFIGILLLTATLNAQQGSTKIVGSPNLFTNQITVSNVATLIVGVRTNRRAVSITHTNTVDIYCGNSANVTIATGDFLTGVKGAGAVYTTTSAIYCITSASTEVVSIAEIY